MALHLMIRGPCVIGLIVGALIMGCECTNECPNPNDTVTYVEFCPKSSQEYVEKASIFNCPKNCGLEFHCVLNANRTSLIALCAPVRIIIGEVCPEYNNHGDRVQRNKFARCSSCPYMFKSNETFKYNECITIKPRDIMAYTTLMQPQRTQKSNPVYSISPKTTAATTSGFLPSLRVLASLPSTAVFLNFICERIYTAILR